MPFRTQGRTTPSIARRRPRFKIGLSRTVTENRNPLFLHFHLTPYRNGVIVFMWRGAETNKSIRPRATGELEKMAWNTIRVATTEEIDLLDARSVAFAMRHLAELPTIGYEEAIDLEGVISVDRSDDEAQTDTKRYLRKLWRRVVSRTLGAGAEGIAWGYVGYHTD